MVVALAVGGLAGFAPGPAAAAAGPGGVFFGLQAWTVPTGQDVAMMKRGGAGSLRAVFDGAVEALPEGVRWTGYDALMTAAGRERIEVLPVLLGIPGDRRRINRPRTRAELRAWGAFVGAVAARYGRGGMFWKLHPELEPMPLTAYQVWNEPNLPAYWRPVSDVAGYLNLVALTRARLLAVDPKATIVLAGVPNSTVGTPMVDYVRAIYAQPGGRNLFDVLAVHPYAEDAAGVLLELSRVRAVMDGQGDRNRPIWVTELGWATGGPPSPFTTTRFGQAARIIRTYRALLAARGRLRLGRIVFFGLQDRAYGATERRWWGPRVGLFDVAGHPKPGWGAFVAFVGGRSGGRLPSVAVRSVAVRLPTRRRPHHGA